MGNGMTSGQSWRAYLGSEQLVVIRMFVTWTVAKEMLERNAKNRSVRPFKVREYSDLMRRGLWTQDHPDTISFTKSGDLINGQHRLLSMVATQVNLVLNVAFGCAEEARLTVDGHTAKTLGDRMWISGRGLGATATDHRKSSEIAVRMMAANSDNKNRASAEDIAQFMQTHRNAIEFVMKKFGSKHKGRLSTSPVKAVIARAYYHVSLDLLSRFVDVFLSGEADLMRPRYNERVIIVLRESLLNHPRILNSNGAGDLYRRVARGLEAFVNNEPLKQVKSISYDPFPLPDRTVVELVEAV
jgi:hypothetical protein